ncbi:MAG: carboxynorspermidine decarboxylase [Phycisphaeraceae bacterium]|nr:carboxynorspermidine decarboxylase [Phycisphaeraceae bacterium]
MKSPASEAKPIEIAISESELPEVPSPCFVVDIESLERNLAILEDVQRRSGAMILLALKGFAMWPVFDRIRRVLVGVTSSSVDEARLGREEFGRQVHGYAPAYSDSNIDQWLSLVDHLSYNSFNQWRRYRDRIKATKGAVEAGIRINPRHSEVTTALYDPCAPGSRLGVPPEAFEPGELEGISGLHFHTLCELNSDSLERTLDAFEGHFGRWFDRMKWFNFGGGHHITRPDYDIERLIRLITRFRARHGNPEVYLEPGEAIALNTGILVATVLDVMHNDVDIAILDTSASAHMPDVLEMPYRPVIEGAAEPGRKPHTYRLGGMTCLAGDVIGDYSFDRPLKVGDRLIFGDMAHYSMVKTTTFNGVRLPSIATFDRASGTIEVVRTFGYEDYKGRLG